MATENWSRDGKGFHEFSYVTIRKKENNYHECDERRAITIPDKEPDQKNHHRNSESDHHERSSRISKINLINVVRSEKYN